jgi:hypothetical protein
MNPPRAACALLLSAAAGLAPACAPRAAAAGETATALTADYFPLRRGTAWTYEITDAGGRRGTGTARVEGLDLSRSGQRAVVVRWDLLDGAIVSWDRVTRAGVVCDEQETRDLSDLVVSEDLYDPPATIVDERPARLEAGAEWSETIAETFPNARGRPRTKEVQVRWRTEAVDDEVTVPAGTFKCLRVRREAKHRPAAVAWYARGIGLVKETGAGRAGDETLLLARIGGG